MNTTPAKGLASVPDWLTNEIVEEICFYMNTFQAESLLSIARKQKNFETVDYATLMTFDLFQATFATSDGEIRVAWSAPLMGRSQIREELVSLAF